MSRRENAIDRRRFLKTSVGAGLALVGCAPIPRSDPLRADGPLFRISLAQWSLNRRFRGQEKPAIDNLDFAKTARGLGIDAIEYVNQFFKDKARDANYIAEMKKRAAGEGVKSLLIMVDGEGALGATDDGARKKAVENHHEWIDAARVLGCHSIRVNARTDGSLPREEQAKYAAAGLRSLTEVAAKYGMNVLVENHGGLSSDGAWLADVMSRVDHERCGTLPDFGNFAVDRRNGIWYDRYLGVRQLMPYAKAVSAKSHSFDPARPFMTIDERGDKETDFLRMMRIVLDAGYRGWVGIEAEGPGDQMDGVRATKRMLLAVRSKLAEEYEP